MDKKFTNVNDALYYISRQKILSMLNNRDEYDARNDAHRVDNQLEIIAEEKVLSRIKSHNRVSSTNTVF